MSHHETWDTKPDAPSEYRGEFRPIATVVPGIRIGEHMPRLAQHTDKLAIIRSMHHRSSAHGKGMYWNITGHPPPAPEVAANLPPSRQDWPCLGAMVSRFRSAPAGFPERRADCPIRWSTTTRCRRATTPAFSARPPTRSSSAPIAAGPGAAFRAISAPWSCSVPKGVDADAPDRPARSARSCSISGFQRPGRLARSLSANGLRHLCSARPCRPRSISTANRPRCATCTAITCAAKACSWPGG